MTSGLGYLCAVCGVASSGVAMARCDVPLAYAPGALQPMDATRAWGTPWCAAPSAIGLFWCRYIVVPGQKKKRRCGTDCDRNAQTSAFKRKSVGEHLRSVQTSVPTAVPGRRFSPGPCPAAALNFSLEVLLESGESGAATIRFKAGSFEEKWCRYD